MRWRSAAEEWKRSEEGGGHASAAHVVSTTEAAGNGIEVGKRSKLGNHNIHSRQPRPNPTLNLRSFIKIHERNRSRSLSGC